MGNRLKPVDNDSRKHTDIHPNVDQLKQFYPVAELSDEHLKTAARLAQLKTVTRGSSLNGLKERSENYRFLLSGSLLLDDSPYESINNQLHLSIESLDITQGELTAESDCQFIEIEKKLLDGMLCWDQVAKSLLLEIASERDWDEDREWLKTLLMSNMFHRVPPFNIRSVLHKFAARTVAADEVIIREGDVGDECYLIKEGRAMVFRRDEQSQTEEDIAELTAGQCFGEDALVNKMRRNASVRMAENGVLMTLKKRDFIALMSEPSVFSVPTERAIEVIDRGEGCWLDVRSQQEYDFDCLEGAFHLPLHLMILKAKLMDPNKRYFAYCGTGKRAINAAYLLQQHGHDVVPVKQELDQIRSLL